MIETLICGYNIFCHLNRFENHLQRNKYPKDVVQLCTYFEQQKVKLPEYCFYKSTVQPPRHRNEY